MTAPGESYADSGPFLQPRGQNHSCGQGIRLYGALCRLIPALHLPASEEPSEAGLQHLATAAANERKPLWTEVAIHPMNGQLIGARKLALTDKSRLTVRADSDRIGEWLPIAGKVLSLDGDGVRVGVPHTYALRPVSRLRNRLVVIKGFLDPEPFLEAVRRQLDANWTRRGFGVCRDC